MIQLPTLKEYHTATSAQGKWILPSPKRFPIGIDSGRGGRRNGKAAHAAIKSLPLSGYYHLILFWWWLHQCCSQSVYCLHQSLDPLHLHKWGKYLELSNEQHMGHRSPKNSSVTISKGQQQLISPARSLSEGEHLLPSGEGGVLYLFWLSSLV